VLPDETYRQLADERSPSQVPFILTAFALLVALGVGLFLIFSLLNDSGTDEGTLVVIPSVEGMSQDDALAALQDLQLKVRLANEPNPEIEAGFVIGTDPAAGDEVASGSFVTVMVSTGVGAANVPPVIGETVDEARRLITLNGLEVGDILEEANDDLPAGTVVNQSPDAGSKQEPGTRVDLWVSTGPGSVLIEDLRGRPEQEVRFLLESAGLVVQFNEEFDNTVADGFVTRTEPPAGSVVEDGSTVTVFLSQGPEPVAVPNVVGMTPDAARAALEALGLEYRESAGTVEVDPALDGLVAEQSVDAGTEVNPGTVVTVVLGVAPPPTTTTTTTTTTAPQTTTTTAPPDTVPPTTTP
jgi:serine/threonine-protein kinase